MNETRAAAERLWRLSEGLSLKSVYGRGGPGGESDRAADWGTLAAAYFADNDLTPVDEAWANTLSLKQLSEGDDIWVLGCSDTGAALCLLHRNNKYGEFWWLSVGGAKVRMVVDRSDVRKLAAALGIELKEEAT